MLKFETRKLDSLLDVEVDGKKYKVDLSDQTPFITAFELVQEMAKLDSLVTDEKAIGEYVSRSKEIQKKGYETASLIFGDKGAEAMIGKDRLNIYKLLNVLEIIVSIYNSAETQAILTKLNDEATFTLDTKSKKAK